METWLISTVVGVQEARIDCLEKRLLEVAFFFLTICFTENLYGPAIHLDSSYLVVNNENSTAFMELAL